MRPQRPTGAEVLDEFHGRTKRPTPEVSLDDEEEDRRPSATAVKSPGLVERRKDCVRHIAAHGPQTGFALCEACNIPRGSISVVMHCDWFIKEADGWHITQEARIAVLEKNGATA